MKHINSKQPETQESNFNLTHEIQSLSEEGALLIIGDPGSGKTEKLCWIMTSHCHQGHVVWLIDPFAPVSRYKGLRVFGRNLNYSEVVKGLREFVFIVNERLNFADTNPNYDPFNEIHIHLAIDEIMNYNERIRAHDKNIMQEFWKICTQSLKQVNMSVSIVSHRNIQTMKQDLVRLYCKWIEDPMVKGKRRCAGWAEKVTVVPRDALAQLAARGALGHEENNRLGVTKIDIPDWMIAPADYNYEAIALPHKA